MNINSALAEQLNTLVTDVETRFTELAAQAEDQFHQMAEMHRTRLDTYLAEKDAQINAIKAAFGTG